MSLSASTVELVVEQAKRQGFNKVTAVWLEIGALSGVEPDAIAFCFELSAKGTAAEGARLHLLTPPGEAWCYDCSKTVFVTERGQPCPDCHGFKLKIAQGDSLRVKEIEVS